MEFFASVQRVAVAAGALLLITAASAQASDLYVAPGGVSSGSSCLPGDPACTFDYALSLASSPDIVHVDFGTYSSAGNISVPSGITVQGPAAAYATVNAANGAGVPALKVGSGSKVRGLRINAATTGAIGIRFGGGASANGIDVRADGTACDVQGANVTVTNSVCELTSTSSSAPAFDATQMTAPGTVTLRNDTIVGETSGLRYVAPASLGMGIIQNFDLFNVIVAERHAASPDCPIRLTGPTMSGTLAFHSTNSDHASVSTLGSCSVGPPTVTQTSLQTAAPEFVDMAAGDFRETPTSPTRGNGLVAEVPVGFLYDITASSPRVVAGQTDIGAFQFVETPINTPGPVTTLTATTATLTATVQNHGLDSSSSFTYGIDAANEVFADAVVLPGLLTDQALSVPIAGLLPNTTYRYVLCTLALNFNPCLGEQTFTTLPFAPVLSGASVSDLTQTTATLAATVNPGNDSAAVHFEYGPTDALGTSSATVAVAKSLTDQATSVALAGLTPGATYRAQAVATNRATTTRGDVFTFTTAASPGGPGDPGNPGGTDAFAIVGTPKARRGTITLMVHVPAAGRVRVRVTAKIAKHKKAATYGTVTLSSKKAGTFKLSVKPTRGATKARSKAKRLSTALAATFTPVTGKAMTLRKTVRVK